MRREKKDVRTLDVLDNACISSILLLTRQRVRDVNHHQQDTRLQQEVKKGSVNKRSEIQHCKMSSLAQI